LTATGLFLRWDLVHFLLGLASNCSPADLCLLNS
jgi:hypothetical protein